VVTVFNKLREHQFSGFPVVLQGTHKFIGLILRDQLHTLLDSLGVGRGSRRGAHFLYRIQVPKPDHSAEAENILIDKRLSEMEKAVEIDLRPAMIIGPHVVTPDCPLSRAFTMFCFIGLRHLVVVDTDHNVVGIVTRQDLLAAISIVGNSKLRFEQKRVLMENLRGEGTVIPSEDGVFHESAYGSIKI
jgi:CBS domain containing-hemolysin-like protein